MTFKENISIIKRSYKFLYNLEKTYVIMHILHSLFSGLIPFVPIYMSALIIDELIGGKDPERLLIYVLVTIGLTFSLHMLNSLCGKIRDYHEDILYTNDDRAFTEKTMSLDYEKIEDTEIYLLREKIKLQRQTGYNLYYLSVSLQDFIFSFVQIISSIAITSTLFFSSSISVFVKLLLLGAIVLVGILNHFSHSKSMKIKLKMFEDCVEFNGFGGYLHEYFSNYKSGLEIRMYGMTELACKMGLDFNKKCHEIMYSSSKRCLKYKIFNIFITCALQILVYGFVVSGVILSGISVGSITKYITTITKLLIALEKMTSSIQMAFQNNEMMATYFSFFDIESKMYQGTLPVEKRVFCDNGDMEYELEFKDVSFKYPKSDIYVLKNINMKLKIGQKLAVVGMNGSGKTTMIKLLCRLYDPTEGEITLNGVDINKYNYDEYMSVFSVVFQDFKLFSFSLGQNVAGAVEYDKEKATDCLIQAGFGERLANLEKGIDTCLYKDFEEDGVEISGGEAQKIALARAIYKNAPFIILDEPTAALDPLAEYEIYSKFNELVGEKTAVYISHRLSSCRFCDDIAVFHEGELIQRGNHDGLIADENGKYHELWNAQSQYYEENRN